MEHIEMRCSAHPPTNGPHPLRRLPYRAPSLHPQGRVGSTSPVARPSLPCAPRWLPGLAVPHGAAVAAVPGATAG